MSAMGHYVHCNCHSVVLCLTFNFLRFDGWSPGLHPPLPSHNQRGPDTTTFCHPLYFIFLLTAGGYASPAILLSLPPVPSPTLVLILSAAIPSSSIQASSTSICFPLPLPYIHLCGGSDHQWDATVKLQPFTNPCTSSFSAASAPPC